MFGGPSFMLGGNMCCGIIGDDLVVRAGPDSHEKSLAKPHARPMDFTGHSLKGMVYVGPEGHRTDKGFKYWAGPGAKLRSLTAPEDPTGWTESE